MIPLQQYLPFTVLKPESSAFATTSAVATVLTVYGIETTHLFSIISTSFKVATVLTVYGIETFHNFAKQLGFFFGVATVLTIYGIETL